jgi:hypothetical protein
VRYDGHKTSDMYRRGAVPYNYSVILAAAALTRVASLGMLRYHAT